ncbi:MAG: hypothetical protein CMP28_15035 [Roseibacillus sp.]|nr:hypothetical protein [Roseibacillus sp.]
MDNPEVILGNSNPRFSGVTSTMLQTLPGVCSAIPVAVLGPHHLPDDVPSLTFREFVKLCRQPLRSGRHRIFHARRNNEMIQALLARKLFGARIKIAFTSTAQRQHTWLTKWLIAQMDGLLTTCTGAAAVLDRPPDRMIPHGVDLKTYAPPSSKQEGWKALGLPGDYGVGVFGRVRPQKGIDILIEAALPLLAKHPGPTLVIVGETTPKFRAYQEHLEGMVAEAGLTERVHFLGKQPHDKLPGLFQGMSLVVALSRNEGFGLTVLEAMASGCAVLASHTGAWRDIIREGTDGATVPCDDIPATRAALDQLFSNSDSLESTGAAGRQRVEDKYEVAMEAKALVDYYRCLGTPE